MLRVQMLRCECLLCQTHALWMRWVRHGRPMGMSVRRSDERSLLIVLKTHSGSMSASATEKAIARSSSATTTSTSTSNAESVVEVMWRILILIALTPRTHARTVIRIAIIAATAIKRARAIIASVCIPAFVTTLVPTVVASRVMSGAFAFVVFSGSIPIL